MTARRRLLRIAPASGHRYLIRAFRHPDSRCCAAAPFRDAVDHAGCGAGHTADPQNEDQQGDHKMLKTRCHAAILCQKYPDYFDQYCQVSFSIIIKPFIFRCLYSNTDVLMDRESTPVEMATPGPAAGQAFPGDISLRPAFLFGLIFSCHCMVSWLYNHGHGMSGMPHE
jgi:hypothetical protein